MEKEVNFSSLINTKLEVNLYKFRQWWLLNTKWEVNLYIMHCSPPDEAGVLDTGAAHGPLAQGGAVGDGPQRLPGHVRPLRGGEHRPRVTVPDQPVN